MSQIEKLEQPLNASERYLYAVCIRLDALIHMMSSFMEVYSNQNNMATTSNEIKQEEVVVEEKKTRKKK